MRPIARLAVAIATATLLGGCIVSGAQIKVSLKTGDTLAVPTANEPRPDSCVTFRIACP